jgi:uncharacterized damage-inducible protein DinB
VVKLATLDPRVAQIARLFDHMAWADELLAAPLTKSDAPPAAVREYAHIAAVEEVWLSRIEQRAPAVGIWPEMGAAEAAALAKRTATAFKALIARLSETTLDAAAKYTNSAAKTFETPLSDILIHVAMHGQYHRGKVNVLLRQGGQEPAPVDFISFARGVPAAITPTTGRLR